jgi:hypothetical protein
MRDKSGGARVPCDLFSNPIVTERPQLQLGCNECLQAEERTNLRSQKFDKFNSLGFLHIKLKVSRICTTYYVPTAIVAKFSSWTGVKNREWNRDIHLVSSAAPFPSSSFTTASYPFPAAHDSGVQPYLSLKPGSLYLRSQRFFHLQSAFQHRRRADPARLLRSR